MAETGLSLVVSKEMLANLQKADSMITNLATKSEQAKNRIVAAFTEMGDKGVGAFIRKLNEAQTKIASLNNVKVQGADFSQFTNSTTQAIDSVNKLTEAIGKVSKGSAMKPSEASNKTVFSRINEEVPQVIKNIHNVETAMGKILVGDKTYTNSALTKINAEIDTAMKKLGEVNKMLQFYAKGEGKKAIGFVDTSGYEKEAENLMRQIKLLDEKRNRLIMESRYKIQKAKQEEELANRYVAMENERRERIQANAKLESDLARKRTNDAKKNYEEQYKAYERMFDEIERRERKLAQQQAKNDSRMRKKDYEKYVSTQDTYSHAMNVSNRAKTLNQELRAIKALEQARGNLNKTDSQYEAKLLRLNAAIRQHKQNIDRATQSSKNLQGSHRGLMNISEQLQRRLALVFSVSQITGYVNKLISVRGEFELQQRALQAILQNREEANKLWEKTVQLAVQSPFQVKELVTYTKQLAAYRVESDKLYDTTKMLADVSAGLGVDMQRLILAYGQVKAANYLRGTELRQFSEAGINILGELATYFTELEGVAVSVGEVFERVSKRMVTFGDVEEVFKRLTSAGGTFYRMQEIQAETLRGQISNLKDSIDIMLNKVGKANEDTLKNTVSLVRKFVESWENIVDILHAAGAAFVIVTTAKLKDALATGVWAKANIAATATQKGLNAVIARGVLALRGLWATLMANPITALLAGLAALGVGLYRLVKRSIDANKAFKDNIEQLSAQNREIKKYTDELAILVKRQNELVESNKELAVTSDEYRENSLEISRIENKRKSIIESINSLDSTYAKNLKKAGLNITELTKQTSEYNQELITRLALEQDLKKLSGDEFLEDFNNATTELNISASKVEASYKKTITSVNKLLQQPEKLSDNARKALENFNNSTEPFLDRFIKLHQETALNANELWGKLDFSPIGTYITKLFEFNTLFDKVEPELRASANTFKDSQLGVNLFSIIADADASEEDKNNAKNKIIDYFEDILDDKGVVGKLREKATNLFANIFDFEWRKENIPNPLDEWKVVYNEFINSLDQEGGSRIAPATLETTLEQLRKDVKGEVDRLTKEIVEYENASEELKKARKAQYESDKISLENYKKIREFLGYTPEKTTKGEKDNTWTNLMRVVKEVNTEFKNLNNTFDKTTALQGTLAKYSDALTTAFEGTGKAFTDFDFTTESGLIEFYDWLIKVIPEVDKLKAQLAKGEIVWDVRINEKELADKDLLDQIEEMFSGYEVSLELQKLNIPPDLAKQLFNVDSLTLPELKEQVLKLKPQFESKDMLDEWDKLMKRINDMETKAQEERLKTYTKYLVKAQSERVKIKLEELRQLEEVEKENAYTPEQKSVIKQAIRDETQSKIDKQIWEDFKNTTLYIQMFDELEYVSTNALKKMRSELLNMRDSLKNLEPSELKEIQDRLAAIGDEIVDRNPFEGLSTSLKDGIKALKTLDEQQEKFNKAQANEDKAKELVDTLQLQVEQTRKRNAELKATGAFNKGTEVILDSQLKTQEKQLEVAIEEYAVAKGITKEEAKQLLLQQQQISEANKKLNKVGSIGSDITGMANDVISALGNWGVEVGEEFTQILGGMGKTFDSLAEINLTEPMSIIKAVVGVLVGISDTLAGIFVGTNDAKRERQIQKELKLVEDLEKSYEKLEKAIENAYDVDTLKKAFDNANKNIDQEIASLEKAIKLEEDKKKTDSDRIKEWEEKIEELQEKRKEVLKEQVENLGGGYDFASITEEFVNAWLDAFKETGNGLSGLEKNFADFWQNVAIKQAVMGGASKILEPFLNEVNKALENDFTISDSEMASIDALGEDAKAKLDAFLQQWYSRWGDMIGDTEQGELSGLQRGIQSVTEETAQALESLLNSTRFFVADSNTKLTLLVDSFTNPESANPILSELRSQSEMIRAIRDMFSSVIGRGSSTHSGAYLKVAL